MREEYISIDTKQGIAGSTVCTHKTNFDNMDDYAKAVHALYELRQVGDVVEANNNRIYLETLNGAVTIVRTCQEFIQSEFEHRRI